MNLIYSGRFCWACTASFKSLCSFTPGSTVRLWLSWVWSVTGFPPRAVTASFLSFPSWHHVTRSVNPAIPYTCVTLCFGCQLSLCHAGRGHRVGARLALGRTMNLFSPDTISQKAEGAIPRLFSPRLLRWGPRMRPSLFVLRKALIGCDWQESLRGH